MTVTIPDPIVWLIAIWAAAGLAGGVYALYRARKDFR